MLSKNSSVSCSKACRRLSSKWNSSSGARLEPRHVADVQPLAGEVVDQRLRARVGQHPLHLPLQHVRVAQLPRDGQIQQLVVRDAAPEEEREARGQLQVGYGVGRTGLDRGRLVLEPEQEARADQDAAHGQLDTCLEAAPCRPVAVQAERDPEVGVGHRAPPGAPRQRRDHGARAGLLLGRGSRRADEQPAAAGRVSYGDGVGKRPGDRHAGDDRLAVRGPVRVPAQVRIEQVLDVGGGLGGEVNTHEARAGGHRRLESHALQDQPVALVAAHARRALHDAGPDPFAVDAHVELVRLAGHSFETAGDAALLRAASGTRNSPSAGEVVAEGGAAARSERQRVADARALIAVGRDEEGLRRGHPPRPAERRLRDPCGGAQVALGECRRQGQRIGVVVEAVRRVVGGQQRRIDVDREQVADGIAVLRAVQAMQGGPAGVGAVQRGAVQRGLQPRHHGVVGRGVRARPSGRGHRAGPELADHRFPDLRVLARPGHVEDVESDSGRQRALVVAGEAVALQDGAGSRLARRRDGR